MNWRNLALLSVVVLIASWSIRAVGGTGGEAILVSLLVGTAFAAFGVTVIR